MSALFQAACASHTPLMPFTQLADGVGEDVHAAAITHQVLGGSLLACLADRAVAHGGEDFTVNVGGYDLDDATQTQTHGPSVRHIMALSDAAAPAGAPILVVCPAVAKPVWAREAARWRPDLRVVALSGRGSFRWPTPGEIVVVNYDLLPPALPAAAPANCVVIADEAHALKSSKAQRTERFRALAESARAAGGRSWLLTATPILNRPPELYALLRAAGCERVIGGWSGLVRAFTHAMQP